MANLIEISKEAMNMLLEGNDDLLNALKLQFNACEIVVEDQFDTGAYINFSAIFNISPVSPQKFFIDDVFLSQENLDYPIGFILFIQSGYLALLELHTYGDDKLPKEFQNYTFYYSKDGNRNDGKRKWSL